MIPRNLTNATEQQLLALGGAGSINDQERAELICWILETPFEKTPSRAWIGEIAAEILGKHVSKNVLWKHCEKADGWQLYFFLIALKDQISTKNYEEHLLRAAKSSEPTIQAFAEEMLWTKNGSRQPTT